LTFDDKRASHIAKISLDTTRINFSSPIVFLCGGNVDVKEYHPQSVRDALMRYLASKNCKLSDYITLAEHFKDWTHDAVYKDLLVFESDIAHMASLIIIILESPGSLTELGIFSENKNIKNKTLVIVNAKYHSESSFINLGPLRHLELLNDSSVYSYNWTDDKEKLNESLGDALDCIREDALARLKNISGTTAFNIKNDGHIAFLIFEIIKILILLKLSEIENFLKILKIEIKRDKLKRLLFLLDKLGFIKNDRRGNHIYYYAISDKNKVDFGGHFNEKDAVISANMFYAMSEDEKRRFSLIKEIKAAKQKSEAN
jgi:hypothetical protein